MMGEVPDLADFPLSICDIVIYMKKHTFIQRNMYLVFVPVPDSGLLKPLGLPR